MIAPAEGASAGAAALPSVLDRVYAELQSVLAGLRAQRALLETTAVEKLRHTSAKLQEVTSATETAATDILDALDRTQGLVDELEAADADGDRARAAGARDRMRDELFGMMGALQFQDITTQQLAHATSLLADAEQRLRQVARLIDPASGAPAGVAGAAGAADLRPVDERTFDPRATTRDAGARQALADAVFA